MQNNKVYVEDNIEKLFQVLPQDIKDVLLNLENKNDIIEIVLDLGREPEVRYSSHYEIILNRLITKEDITYVLKNLSPFTLDNRAGISGTLHRISAIRNRRDEIIGLTCRVGRALYGIINIIEDIIKMGKNTIFLGRPGIGKTTLLRESARILSTYMKKRVIIVDTSNEIGGDGDIPHRAIGRARRMQVKEPEMQHKVMIEAVENHMPEVVIIDEIGTEAEAKAARTIAERGVQLIATAHGNDLKNLLQNPTLSDLVGGLQAVILSDEVAQRRGTQKTILERKAPPTFDIVIEIQERDKLAIHYDVAKTVDLMLRGLKPQPEVRVRNKDNSFTIKEKALDIPEDIEKKWQDERSLDLEVIDRGQLKIFPFAVSSSKLKKAIDFMNVDVTIVKDISQADIILTLKSQMRKNKKLKTLIQRDVPVYALRSNTINQAINFLKEIYNVNLDNDDINMEDIMAELEIAIERINSGKTNLIELMPRNSYIRRFQHRLIEKMNLSSKSIGKEPDRRVVIYKEDAFNMQIKA